MFGNYPIYDHIFGNYPIYDPIYDHMFGNYPIFDPIYDHIFGGRGGQSGICHMYSVSPGCMDVFQLN
jgi:hypothetical protein